MVKRTWSMASHGKSYPRFKDTTDNHVTLTHRQT